VVGVAAVLTVALVDELAALTRRHVVRSTAAHHRPVSERRFDGVQLENRQIGTLRRRKADRRQDFL
jgi:hypothetical protein